MLKEWPLVAFTVAAQSAVGVFLVAALPLLAAPGPDPAARRAGLVALVAAVGTLAAAAALSFVHVRHLWRARRVLANLGTSWLSREILFELAFLALAAAAGLSAWLRPGAGGLLTGLLAAAALAGTLFLTSMAGIYALATAPFRDRAWTPLSFALTALGAGALAAAWLRACGAAGPSAAAGTGPFVLLSFVSVAAEAAGAFLVAPGYGLFLRPTAPSLRPPAERHSTLHVIRMALLAAALALVGAVLAGAEGRTLLAAALGLFIAAATAGRFLFYGLAGPRPESSLRYFA